MPWLESIGHPIENDIHSPRLGSRTVSGSVRLLPSSLALYSLGISQSLHRSCSQVVLKRTSKYSFKRNTRKKDLSQLTQAHEANPLLLPYS